MRNGKHQAKPDAAGHIKFFLRIPHELHEQILEVAKHENRSRPSMIRHALQTYISERYDQA